MSPHGLSIAGLVLGLLLLFLAFFTTVAAGMSTNYEASNRADQMGCTMGIIGLLALIGSIVGLIVT